MKSKTKSFKAGGSVKRIRRAKSVSREAAAQKRPSLSTNENDKVKTTRRHILSDNADIEDETTI